MTLRLTHLILAALTGLGLGVVGVACGDGECEDNDGDKDCGNDGDELSCNTYCTSIMANCSAAPQYETMEDCVATCGAFPLGAAADTSGNTLGCRSYHANAAASDAATHCTHAGPGGDGMCGSNCDGYCTIALAACTGANQVYASAAECQTDCKAHGTDVKYDVAKDSGNQVACLLSHASVATLVPEDHCLGDLTVASGTCQDGGGELTCDNYCTTIMANCSGATAQYETMEDCVATCGAFPIGAAADTAGNTLGCRTYHAGAAAADAGLHCTHAGPGGDGACGSNCDGYCTIALVACTGANQVYTSAAECQTDCAAHGTDVKYDVTKDSGNQVACLLSHVSVATLVPEDHCLGDLTVAAGTCQDP